MNIPTRREVVGPPPDPSDTVTVVIATYDHSEYIEGAVRSVAEQETDFPFHVVVFDDASTDGTTEILRRVAADYPLTVQLVIGQENEFGRGLSAPERTLTGLVTPYVAWCEGDDQWIDQYKLAKQVAFMEANPWCSISHHDIEIDVTDGRPEYATVLRDYLETMNPGTIRTPGVALARGNFIMWCTAMARTAAIDPAWLPDLAGVWLEDYALCALIAERGDIGFIPEAMSRYRIHGSGIWSTLGPAEQMTEETIGRWFIATHAVGPLGDSVLGRMPEVLAPLGDEALVECFRRMAQGDRDLRRKIAELRDRITGLEGDLRAALVELDNVLEKWGRIDPENSAPTHT